MRGLVVVPKSKAEVTRKMLNEYLMELSEFDPDIKFDENGTPIYRWFDVYFIDKDRFPLYLVVDGEVAGLALIRELEDNLYDFAEFYVRPEFRKDGNSIYFAKSVTELFDGEFTFATRFTNPRAIKFWTKVAELFEDASFVDDEIWRTWNVRRRNVKSN